MSEKKEVSLEVNESEYLKHSKEHALRTSLAEGCAQSVAVNMSSGFLTPFMLAVGGNSFHVGLLSSLNGLADPVGEITGSKMMERHSRKKLLINVKIWIAILQVPMILVAYLFWKGALVPALPWIMILLWGLAIPFIFGIGYVSFLSWLGDLIPSERKGEFFANRGKVTGIVGLITFLITGFLLDLFKTKGYVLLGFSILFGVAIFFRLMSAHYTSKVFNPQFRAKKKFSFSFAGFLKRYDNYGKFTVYQAIFNFAIMISAPFFAVYMLEDLKFDYTTYTFISLSSTIFYLIFSPLAGKFSDRYGNIKLISIGAFLFPLVPLLWIFLKHPIALALIPGLVSGLANAAFVIGTTDFSYDSTSKEKRGICFSYSALLTGFGILGGSFIGGFLVEYVPINFMRPLFFVFVLSSVLMIFASLYFLPQLKESRSFEKIKGLHLDLIHPVKTIHSMIVWNKQMSHWQPHLMNKAGKK
ncbi:MAG: MFS transporter [Nanoarchaeota archaeon]